MEAKIFFIGNVLKGKALKIPTLKINNHSDNLCIRCGKQRVVVKTWREYFGKSLLTYTSAVCPDAACQKIVDRQLAAQKERREAMERNRGQKQGIGKGINTTNRQVKKT